MTSIKDFDISKIMENELKTEEDIKEWLSINLEMYLEDGNLLIKYENIKSVTPGQACVLYQDDICLGGGIIKEVRKDNEKLWYLL